jgi:hypothetical protein
MSQDSNSVCGFNQHEMGYAEKETKLQTPPFWNSHARREFKKMEKFLIVFKVDWDFGYQATAAVT